MICSPKLSNNKSRKLRGNILLVHSGRRDEYEVAMALSKYYSVTLLTDFYFSSKSVFSWILKRVLGDRVYLRSKNGLDCQIVTSIPLLILDFMGKHYPRNTFIFRMKNKFFEIKSKNILRKKKFDYVLFYSNHGASNIFRNELNGCKKILFQMHPHPDLILDVYKKYITSRKDLKDLIQIEEEEFTDDVKYKRALKEEAHLSDLVICTTSFTKRSLIYAGIESEKIVVIPYGVTIRKHSLNELDLVVGSENGIINLAFVGQFVVRKGIYELLDAVKTNPSIYLNIYTRDAYEAERVIREYMSTNIGRVNVKNIIDNDKLWSDVKKNNFLILPSIAEGFGLVILEAMSFGLPVIASRNTAGPDIINDGVDGFLLTEVSPQAINQLINRLLLKKTSWSLMRFEALKKAKQNKFTKFRKMIVGAVGAI